MYSKGKGLSDSVVPYRLHTLEWKGITQENLIELICDLAKKGLTPSQIGLVIRDTFSIVDLKNITGFNVSRILSMKGITMDVPEDLYHLIKKVKRIKSHLEKYPKDFGNRFKLSQIENHVYRLSVYYKRTKRLPLNWEYKKYIIKKNY